MTGRSIHIGSRVPGYYVDIYYPPYHNMEKYGTNIKRLWIRILAGQYVFSVGPNICIFMWNYGLKKSRAIALKYVGEGTPLSALIP